MPKKQSIGKPNPLVSLHYGIHRDAPQHPQPQKAVALANFSNSFYTDEDGMQFRRSGQKVFTYRPSTKELVFLCSVDEWPRVAKRLGVKQRKPTKVRRTSAD